MTSPNDITLEGIKIITTGPQTVGSFGDTVRPLVCRYEDSEEWGTDRFIIWQKRFDNGEWATTPGTNPNGAKNLLISLLTA